MEKRKRDSEELESNVGPTVDIISEFNVKKKKRRSDVAKYEKKKKINVDLDVAMPDMKKKKKKKTEEEEEKKTEEKKKKKKTEEEKKKKTEEKKKKKKKTEEEEKKKKKRSVGGDLDIDGGPTDDYVADISSDSFSDTGSDSSISDTDSSSEDEDDDDEEITEVLYVYTGVDEGGGGNDYNEPTGDDEGKDDEENGREMLSKKKKKKRRVKEVVEAIKAVAETACEAALSEYIASHQKKKKKKSKHVRGREEAIKAVTKTASEAALSEYIASHQKTKKKSKLAQLQHDYSDRGREEAIKAVAKAASEAALSEYIASHQKTKKTKKKKKSKLAQLQHDYSDRGREEEDPSMDLGHKVQMRNAGDTTLVTANNQSLPLQQPWTDAPSWEANMLVKTALRAYNKKFSDQGVHEFAGGLHINAFIDKGIHCHINFHVRLVDDANPSDSDPKLIFAELARNCSPEYQVTVLDVLGYVSQDIPPRLRGCRACDTPQHRNVLRHGDVEFNPGVDPGFWFKGMTRDEIRKTFNIRMT